MESIAKGCGIYFDAHDPDSIAAVIESFLNKGEFEIPLDKEKERIEILNQYQWENSARLLLQAFDQLVPSCEAGK